MMAEEQTCPSPKVQDNRRRRASRYIAVGSFVYLITQGTVLTTALILSDDRSAIAAVFGGASTLMIATNAMLVSVVLGYMGISTTERIKLGEPS